MSVLMWGHSQEVSEKSNKSSIRGTKLIFKIP